MTSCIVHIGMPKTGTSSIQQSLDGFTDRHFVYSTFGGHPNHSRAIFAMLDFEHPLIPRLDDSARANAITEFRRSMADAGDRTYVVSGEGLSLLPSAKLKNLHDYLLEWFREVTVAAAIRAPAAFMTSAFQERIRRQRGNYHRLYHYRSYKKAFDKFDRIFGRANVRLWKFDPASYPAGCAVRDFCDRFGIALPANRLQRVNESLSREALGLLYTYRRLGQELGSTSMTGPQNARLARVLMTIGRSRFRFSPDVIRPILAKNRADIDWMEARLGQSLSEDLEEHRPGDVRDESDLLSPDPWAVCELLKRLRRPPAKMSDALSQERVAQLVHELRAVTDNQPDETPPRHRLNIVQRLKMTLR